MNAFISTPLQIVFTLFVSALLITSCSSSNDTQSPILVDVVSSNGVDNTSNDDTEFVVTDNASADGTADETVVDTPLNDTEGQTSTGNGSETPTLVQEPINSDSVDDEQANSNQEAPAPNVPDSDGQNPMESNPAVADPLVQNTTRVSFDIQVPVYQSDALQVRLTWGEIDILAGWVGDEFWSVADDFPTDTEQLLIVTFSDANGELTLGSFEQTFKTGINTAESYTITADQFDSSQWDDDGDGISNLEETAETEADPARVLLFSETRDFRHTSIETALITLEQLATSAGIQTIRAADSEGLFTDANLAGYDAVVWVMTSGDVLNADEQAAFEQYIRSGGGYAGIHAASFTEYEWPWYGSLVGAYFDSHPAIQSASQAVEDASHLSTAHLGATWTRTDEWYDYRSNPRANVNVLLSLDESSYTGGAMGEDHPSAWYHDYDGGRSWYTGGGHTDASYSEPAFRAHLLGGLRYAVGRGE